MITVAHTSKELTEVLEQLQRELYRWRSGNKEWLNTLTLARDCVDDCLAEATKREEVEMDETRREEEDRMFPYDKYAGSGAGR